MAWGRVGSQIAPHHHPRDQLLYSVTGVMRVRTRTEAWIVPPDRAVYLPAHVEHSIGLIQNEHLDLGKIQRFLLRMVQQTPRRRRQDVDAPPQIIDLLTS